VKRPAAALLRAPPAIVSGVAVALSVAPMRSLIEQSMVWHMVVQMPLLVFGGWLAMRAALRTAAWPWLDECNRYGLTGLIAVQAVVAYWMLPLAIDRAVVLPQFDLLKVATLWAGGALLRHSAERAPVVLQLFFVGTTVSMLVWLGTFFASTELRLCNAYSLQTQVLAGQGTVGLGVTIGAIWLLRTLTRAAGPRRGKDGRP